MAVVHSHDLLVIPFGITGQALRLVFHMAAFFGADLLKAVFRAVNTRTSRVVDSDGPGVGTVSEAGAVALVRVC